MEVSHEPLPVGSGADRRWAGHGGLRPPAGETDEVNSRLLSLGYSCAIFGPFLLLVYVATLPSALLVAAAVSGLLWGADWLAKRTRGRRWTSGAARYGSDAFLMVLAYA
jgi:signal peptidase I